MQNLHLNCFLLIFGNLKFLNIIRKCTNLKMLYRYIKIQHYDVRCLFVKLEQNDMDAYVV